MMWGCGFKDAYQRIKGHVSRRPAGRKHEACHKAVTPHTTRAHSCCSSVHRHGIGKYVFVGYGGTSFGPVCQAVEIGYSHLPKYSFSLLWTA